jgi:hypothetical protein
MLDLLRTQGRWAASARLAYQVCFIIITSYYCALLLTVPQYDCIALVSLLSTSAATTAQPYLSSTATACLATMSVLHNCVPALLHSMRSSKVKALTCHSIATS